MSEHPEVPERIFHLALLSDWEAARAAGDYRVSTLGVTLADEGFIHASRADQWQPVRNRFYAGVTEPLVLLVIDPARLTCELRIDYVAEADDTFPHLYGPLNLDAVVETVSLDE